MRRNWLVTRGITTATEKRAWTHSGESTTASRWAPTRRCSFSKAASAPFVGGRKKVGTRGESRALPSTTFRQPEKYVLSYARAAIGEEVVFATTPTAYGE